MSLKSMTLSLSAAQMSDLYFNFEHPSREKFYLQDAEFSDEELDAADRADAEEFAQVLGIYDPAFVAALVLDFRQRI